MPTMTKQMVDLSEMHYFVAWYSTMFKAAEPFVWYYFRQFGWLSWCLCLFGTQPWGRPTCYSILITEASFLFWCSRPGLVSVLATARSCCWCPWSTRRTSLRPETGSVSGSVFRLTEQAVRSLRRVYIEVLEGAIWCWSDYSLGRWWSWAAQNESDFSFGGRTKPSSWTVSLLTRWWQTRESWRNQVSVWGSCAASVSRLATARRSMILGFSEFCPGIPSCRDLSWTKLGRVVLELSFHKGHSRVTKYRFLCRKARPSKLLG